MSRTGNIAAKVIHSKLLSCRKMGRHKKKTMEAVYIFILYNVF